MTVASNVYSSTNSPRSDRGVANHANSVVRSPEPQPSSPNRSSPSPSSAVSVPPDASVDGGEQRSSNGNAAAAASAGNKGKKLAWNRPSTNGASESGPAVMGAVSWPALSESTKPSSRSSSSESVKAFSFDASAPSGSVVSSPSPMPKTSNASSGIVSGNVANRQKSMTRSGNGSIGSSSSGNSVVNTFQEIASPSSAPLQLSGSVSGKQIAPDASPKNIGNGGNNGDHVSGSSGNDRQRGYNKKGNNGGGPHHGNYQNRKDQDRGGYDWNQPRVFSSRDARIQPTPPQHGVARPYLAPPSPAGSPFIPPPSVRPFVNPMGYPEIAPPMFYYPAPVLPEASRPIPFIPPQMAPMMFVPQQDNRATLLKQIDYYFSSENLCKDTFLRQNMDEQGWVPVDLIANFNRVKQLTNNKEYILDVIQASEVVEVKDEKIRKRSDWIIWLLPPTSSQYSSSLQSQTAQNHDFLIAQLQNAQLDDGTSSHNRSEGPNLEEVIPNITGSADTVNQSEGSELRTAPNMGQ